jgi:hypothetical protein
MTTTKQARQRTKGASAPADAETPIHVELAAEAILEGWTREQVIDTLVSRLRRDRRYLAYRKACNRRTSYDDQVQQDMRALALAACWLAETGTRGATSSGGSTSMRLAKNLCLTEPHNEAPDKASTPACQREAAAVDQPRYQEHRGNKYQVTHQRMEEERSLPAQPPRPRWQDDGGEGKANAGLQVPTP